MPPSTFVSGTLDPTSVGTSAIPVAVELAAEPANAAPFPTCARLIIGDAAMLAGTIPTCATDTSDVAGTAVNVADS